MKGFIKWALLTTLVNAVLAIIGYLLMDEDAVLRGEGMGQTLWYLGMVIGLVFLFLGIREKKMENPGDFTFGKGFANGLLISVFAGLFTGLFSYLFYSLVAPEVIDLIREGSFNAMQTQGMPQEQIDQAKPMMEFFISPMGFFISTLLMYAIAGTIVSLIMAAIVNAMGPKSGGNEPVAV